VLDGTRPNLVVCEYSLAPTFVVRRRRAADLPFGIRPVNPKRRRGGAGPLAGRAGYRADGRQARRNLACAACWPAMRAPAGCGPMPPRVRWIAVAASPITARRGGPRLCLLYLPSLAGATNYTSPPRGRPPPHERLTDRQVRERLAGGVGPPGRPNGGGRPPSRA